jgi:hypothetical protein
MWFFYKYNMPIKVELDTLSDEQLGTLKNMLRTYKLMKFPSTFVKKRMNEIEEVLSNKEPSIKGRSYSSVREY